jgi:hypothetical protein
MRVAVRETALARRRVVRWSAAHPVAGQSKKGPQQGWRRHTGSKVESLEEAAGSWAPSGMTAVMHPEMLPDALV